MLGLWKSMRRRLAKYKKSLVNKPRGLKRFDKESLVMRPWRFEGERFIQIGSRSVIFQGSNICAVAQYEGQSFTPSIWIGNDVYIGHYAFLTAISGITIGDGCVLSEHVYVTDFFHGFAPDCGLIMKQALVSKGPVVIGPNCFLGYRVAVMPGVTLGEWCIVGTNSVVTRSFPAYSMVAGSPARLVKVYSHELKEWVMPTSSSPNGSEI